MKKESDNRIEMSRRGFLKAAALTGGFPESGGTDRSGNLRVPGVGESAGGRESRQW